jgi:tetratricopeptide (TPR) repeat protein
MQKFARLPLAVLCLFAVTFGVHAESGRTPDSPEALMDAGHWKRARTLVEARYKAAPANPVNLHLMARVKWAFGDEASAFDFAQRAIALDPSRSEFHAYDAFMYGQKLNETSALSKVSTMRQFNREVDAALAANPQNTDALLMRAVFLAAAPRLVGGDVKKADEIGTQLVKLDPADGYLKLARLAKNEGNFGKMEDALKRAVAQDPHKYAAHFQLAELYCCLLDSPRWDLAEQKAHDAIQIDPSRAAAYGVLARVFAHKEKWADLDALMAQVDRTTPEDLSPYYYAALRLRLDNKDFQRAERYLRKYLSQEPEGDTPSLPLAHWELGLTLEKLGRRAEAARELELVAAAKPHWEQVRKDLKRVK